MHRERKSLWHGAPTLPIWQRGGFMKYDNRGGGGGGSKVSPRVKLRDRERRLFITLSWTSKHVSHRLRYFMRPDARIATLRFWRVRLSSLLDGVL